jgi:hypothetical protein
MSFIKGTKALTNVMDRVSTSGQDREKTRWFKINAGQTVKVRFLQEVDADSSRYSEKNGLVLAASEHTKPSDYRVKCVCTMADENKCYGCEQNVAEPRKGWNARTRLYANVLVDDGKETPYVAIISQGFSGKSITPMLLQAAENYGTISDRSYSITRMGSGTDTSYTLFPGAADEKAFDVEAYELFDLEKAAVRQVAYAEQEAFFNGGSEDRESGTSSADTDFAW